MIAIMCTLCSLYRYIYYNVRTLKVKMSSKTSIRPPKRRIEKIVTAISQTSSASVQNIALHTAEDAKTLIRTVVDLIFYAEANAVVHWALLLHIKPNNTNIYSPTLGSSVDSDVNSNYVMPFNASAYGDTTSATPPAVQIMRVTLDTKAMRKLKPTDVVALASIANSVNGNMRGTITQWFKE